jgi:hypothetical protein
LVVRQLPKLKDRADQPVAPEADDHA